MKNRKHDAGGGIEPVPDCQPLNDGLDLEVWTVRDLRTLVGERLRATQRIEFHLLIGVTHGHGIHTVDFAPVECRPQTWVVLRPGQVQQFDPAAGWDGWLTTFRPEFIRSETTQLAGTSAAAEAAPRLLSGQVELSDADHKACLETVERMALDAAALVDLPARHALLQSQLRTLRLRLQLAQRQSGGFVHAPDAAFDLFQRFEQLIDADLSHNHNVGEYAKKLGCSERTLTRATTSVRSVSAKAFLSQRIALEAKRLLIHTARTVAQIASDIGFDEATNFVKFFRREVGIPPGEFRLHYAERYG